MNIKQLKEFIKYIKYCIFVYKNRKDIQKCYFNISAHGRTTESRIYEIKKLLKIKSDPSKQLPKTLIALLNPDLFNYEKIEIKKSDAVKILDEVRKIAYMLDNPNSTEYLLITDYKKYLYK